ncbi:hypothetical protein GCM10017786_04350 [Amycolatopsis deserti]|uniref:WXG100 family type VII secretion target n=1 Tax=Amycolatopsis deserti TaxID=185696 RepID=A0ABQ3IBK1_9PSEU|nr:hypothetical protein [Amycolatopsis deserti]GHE77937.1 hypothetical protein GCM10017786_04350 [Amycolatopsis deserti]
MAEPSLPLAFDVVIVCAESTGYDELADLLRTAPDWEPRTAALDALAELWGDELGRRFADCKNQLETVKSEVKHVWAGDAAYAFARHVDDTLARHAEYQAAAGQVAVALGRVNKAMATCAADCHGAVNDAAAAIMSAGLLGVAGFASGTAPVSVTGAVLTIMATLSGKVAQIQAIVERDAGAALAELREACNTLAQLTLPPAMAESLKDPAHWLPKPYGSTVLAKVPPGFGEHLAQVSADHFGKDVSAAALRRFEAGFDLDGDGLEEDEYLAAAEAISGYADDIELDGSPVPAPAAKVTEEPVVGPPPLEMPGAQPVAPPPLAVPRVGGE